MIDLTAATRWTPCRVSLLTVAALALTIASPDAAHSLETEFVPAESATTDADENGWSGTLGVAANLSLNSNRDVVGQPDGATWTFGSNIAGNLRLLKNDHEWRAETDYQLTYSKTPLIDDFFKSFDKFVFETLYFYHLPAAPWFGPFARFRLSTAFFSGFDVQPQPVTYLVPGEDPPPVTDRLQVTDPFRPLTLRQSAGVFARPVASEPLDIDIRLGFGARETFADDQLAVADDDATPEIEVVELRSFNQAGAEGVAVVGGSVSEGKISYEASAEVLIPFINDLEEDDDRSALDLTNVEVAATVKFAIVDWASLDYELSLLRDPQLVDDWQIANNLLLSVSYQLIER